MTRSKIAWASLLCCCSVAYAQDRPELDALRFTPHPISEHARLSSAVEAPGARRASGRADGRGAAPGGGRGGGLEDTAEKLWAAVGHRLDAIEETESLEGARSTAMIDELTALAALYQELGEHSLALAVLEQALHIRRVNDGLFSLEQVDIVEQIIASRKARDEYDEYAALEGRVRELATRNFDDPRAAHVLSTAGDRHMEAFYELLDEDEAVEIRTSTDGSGWRASLDGYSAAAALRAARRNYDSALRAALMHESYDVPELLELQRQIVDTYYVEVLHQDDLRSSRFAYGSALGVLRAMVSNASRFETPAAAGQASMEVGDWHLLASRNGTALETYRAAYELMEDADLADEEIESVMSFDVPRALPVLGSARRDGHAPQHYRGYIDVSFEITKYGVSKNVDVLGRSPGTSDDVERRLKRHVSSSRFRPAFEHGSAIGSEAVAVRYYFTY